ncbi:unnamed protein product [Lupinus luteus]|uniref:Annexin n=1 Tax=Lupinus luteus TaxID=3873 RepID=A0AAV1YKV4_LUPLU
MVSKTKQKAMYRWMSEPADRDAVLAHVAINHGSKHYHVLVEIVSILSPEEVLNVRRAYHDRYKRSLEEDIAAQTTGDLRQGKELVEDAITRVVVSRVENDMKDIMELYYKRNSVHLEDEIAKEFHGDYKKFILTLLGKEV